MNVKLWIIIGKQIIKKINYENLKMPKIKNVKNMKNIKNIINIRIKKNIKKIIIKKKMLQQ